MALRSNRKWILLLLGVAFVGLVLSSFWMRMVVRVTREGNEALRISDKDYPTLATNAMNGDEGAARKLWGHFEFVVRDKAASYHWERRCAELGNQTMRDDLARLSKKYELISSQIVAFSDKVDKGDIQAAYRLFEYYQFTRSDDGRSYYWLTRAAALGDKRAQESLARFDARLKEQRAK